jgi:hypothetical protein
VRPVAQITSSAVTPARARSAHIVFSFLAVPSRLPATSVAMSAASPATREQCGRTSNEKDVSAANPFR